MRTIKNELALHRENMIRLAEAIKDGRVRDIAIADGYLVFKKRSLVVDAMKRHGLDPDKAVKNDCEVTILAGGRFEDENN